MLIKTADDQTPLLEDLERRAMGGGPDATRAEDDLRRRRAGIKGEQESTYLIDFDYAKSPNWAVLHDLRLEHDGRVAQIDHLLINRWMDVYVLETKHFHAGVKITEDGEFLRWNSYRRTYEGMASPLEQTERQIQVLTDVMARIELPTRLGMRIPPTFQSYVLIGPQARIDRPEHFDASRVVKADQLKKAIWRDIENDSMLSLLRIAAKFVSRETVEFIGRQLAAQHRPKLAGLAANEPADATPAAASGDAQTAAPPRIGEPALAPDQIGAHQPVQSGPTCKECSANAGNILYGRYGYYFKCSGCDTNTSIRFSCRPGHDARLRKSGDSFFRDCAQCDSSVLFHQNT